LHEGPPQLLPETADRPVAGYPEHNVGEEKSDIVDRGIVYAYVMRKALPPELIIVVERMADEIMAASCVMPVDR
jgi:hypothetical protein